MGSAPRGTITVSLELWSMDATAIVSTELRGRSVVSTPSSDGPPGRHVRMRR